MKQKKNKGKEKMEEEGKERDGIRKGKDWKKVRV